MIETFISIDIQVVDVMSTIRNYLFCWKVLRQQWIKFNVLPQFFSLCWLLTCLDKLNLLKRKRRKNLHWVHFKCLSSLGCSTGIIFFMSVIIVDLGNDTILLFSSSTKYCNILSDIRKLLCLFHRICPLGQFIL